MSAYKHAAFWGGDRPGWRGFRAADVHVGEQVTFVRRGGADRVSSSVSAPPASEFRPPGVTAQDADQSTARPDVVLVGCVRSKLPHPAPAKDLYLSPLFRSARTHAEASGRPWFILSAEHGLIYPDEVTAPYERPLATQPVKMRRAWGAKVVEQLETRFGDLHDKTFEVHAGSAYVDAIRDGLLARGAHVEEPLRGLPLGQRLAWYRSGTEAANAPLVSAAARLADLLRREHDALTPSEFLASHDLRFRGSGLYSWWVDEGGAKQLSAALGLPVSSGLIYAGLAGAKRTVSGRVSKNTLDGRIRTMHLGRRHDFSTFRRSLAAILRPTVGNPPDEAALTAWMHEHLRVIAVPFDDRDALDAVETQVLAELDPPLNLRKMPSTPLRKRLSELRRGVLGGAVE